MTVIYSTLQLQLVVNMFANQYRIYIIQLSCSDGAAREELGGGRDFVCFNQDYLGTEFKLVKCSDLQKLKLKYHTYGNLHEIKIQNTTVKNNEKVSDYLDTEFHLVKCDTPKKFYVHGAGLHEIKIRNTAAKSNIFLPTWLHGILST